MTSPVTKTAPGSILPQVAAVLASLLAVASLPAQTAEAPAAAPAKDSEVVILSPFQVNDTQTHGYQATNSIGATRSSTPIKDVPLNIQVFTKDLADDIAANSQIDLERYNAALTNGGADSHSSNAIQQAYGAFLFRGFVQNWGLRDGIREYDPVDMQGIARVEVVKGPAAPLYGLAYPGGIMNTISKQVDFTGSFANLKLSAQSYGEYRAAIDANYVGNVGNGGKFGVRVNAARANTEDDRDNSAGTVRYTQLNLAWMPTPQTEIKFLAEDGYRAKPALLTGGYFSHGGANGADTPLQIAHPEIPWTWNTADKYNKRDDDTFKYRGTVTQSIGENFSVTAYVETNGHKQSDTSGWDAAGGGGSNASWDLTFAGPLGFVNTGWITNEAGQEVIRKAFHTRSWNNTVHAYGATAVYKLETGPVKNTFTVGGNAWAERFYSIKGTTRFGSNQYIDFPISTSVNPNNVPQFPGSDYYIDIGATPDENNSNDYYFASWQASALDNRLKFNAAINRTNIKIVQHTSPTPNVTKASKNSPLIGAMFDVTKEVSIFAAHSTSLFPTTDKNDFDVQMPVKSGKGNEAGIKIELLGGKISGTISAYQIEETGGSVQDETAMNRDKAAWDANVSAGRAGPTGINGKYGWPDGQIPAGEESYIAWASASDAQKTAARNSLTDRNGRRGDLVPNPAGNKSKGYEADLVFQPTPEWQMMLSYAHNTVTNTPTGHAKDQLSMLTKYSFTQGPVNGLSVGLGLQYAGKAYQDANNGGRYNPSTFYAEAFAGYKFKAFGYDHKIQLNLKNLTKQDGYVGWSPKTPGAYATERFKVPSKLIWNVSYELQF